jgi:steroid 5-alpha reductase family enzyme
LADTIFARVLIFLIVIEYTADQQMWNYQQAKKEYQSTAKVPQGWTRAQMDRGFLTTGLWKYSRHPNFLAEQTIWVVLYQWCCYKTTTLYNWTAVGMFSYMLVFQGSTPLTEWISGSKYPEYKVYQQRVGKFLPKLIGKGWDEKQAERVGSQLAKEQDGKVKEGKKGK